MVEKGKTMPKFTDNLPDLPPPIVDSLPRPEFY
jgi:hypothetical protein